MWQKYFKKSKFYCIHIYCWSGIIETEKRKLKLISKLCDLWYATVRWRLSFYQLLDDEHDLVSWSVKTDAMWVRFVTECLFIFFSINSASSFGESKPIHLFIYLYIRWNTYWSKWQNKGGNLQNYEKICLDCQIWYKSPIVTNVYNTG